MKKAVKSLKERAIIVFQDKGVRRAWYDNMWYFSVVDVVEALTGSREPRKYWHILKRREFEQSQNELPTICRRLKLKSLDGKMRATDCANTESMFVSVGRVE